jgi:predicted ester cyclase
MNKIINVFAVVFISATTILLSGCAEKSIPVNVQDTLDKYVGFWNTGQFDGIENVLAEDYELLESPGYEPQKGIELLKKTITEMLKTYPDFNLVINETVYEKDKIAAIWTIAATNTGPGEMPPTGRTIKGQGLSVIHLKDGKIKDEWLANNNLLWMTQLGFTFVPPTSGTDQTKQ